MRARPDAPLRQWFDARQVQAPGLRHLGNKVRIDVLHTALRQRLHARVKRQTRIVGTGQPSRAVTTGVDANLTHEALARRQYGEDANGAGDRGRVGHHGVAGHGNPIPARGRHVAHGHNHGLALLTRQSQLVAHQFRAQHAATG